jgi:hypothetical protein
MVTDNAALSISDIRNDFEQIIPAAEAALLEMRDAMAGVWTGLLPDIKQEIKPAVVAEVSATVVTVNKLNTANIDQKEVVTLT